MKIFQKLPKITTLSNSAASVHNNFEITLLKRMTNLPIPMQEANHSICLIASFKISTLKLRLASERREKNYARIL